MVGTHDEEIQAESQDIQDKNGNEKSTKKSADYFGQLAKQYVMYMSSLKRYPLYTNGKFYLYRDTRYVEEVELDQSIRSFFKARKLSQSNNIIGNVKEIVKNLAYRSATDHGPMPFYVGAEPFPKPGNIIAFNNGLLDLGAYLQGKFELIPHTSKWASTVCLPYNFNPDAECPLWLKFLNEVFETDVDKANLLQEWFGYSMTTDGSQHKLLVLTGVPRAGKGTTMRILSHLVGGENSTGYNLHSLAERFGLRQLIGKLVAFVGEVNLVNSREKYRILETLNSIVGGDEMSIEEKHNPLSRSVVLPVKFIVACNEMPAFVDPSGALAARLSILDYNRSFEGRENRELDEQLSGEITGISAWALRGLYRLRQQGRFTETQYQRGLVNRFRRENSDILGFVQDCLTVQRDSDPGNLVDVAISDKPLSVSKGQLENAYQLWCAENNKEPNLNWLPRNLRTILPKLEYNRTNKIYAGIALLTADTKGTTNPTVPETAPTMTDEEFQQELNQMM